MVERMRHDMRHAQPFRKTHGWRAPGGLSQAGRRRPATGLRFGRQIGPLPLRPYGLRGAPCREDARAEERALGRLPPLQRDYGHRRYNRDAVMQAANGRVVLSPSDLNDYVECPHLTTLSLEVARDARRRTYVAEDYGNLLRDKGKEHEAAYLAELRARGRRVVDVIGANEWDFDASARATINAMRGGAEIIYQATFVQGDWRGRADFLERVDQPTALGEWGYEALDAKLARAEKPTYVLQLCFYTEAIASIQRVTPEKMHVLLGIGERRTLRHADFAAYYRRVRAGFLAALGRATKTEPYPVEHCALCEFRQVCDEQWAREDHLSLVAGIRREQVSRLRSASIHTLEQLAWAPAKPAQVAPGTYETLHNQAGLQLRRRITGIVDWQPLAAEPGCGFERLPRPSPGDVIFDIEGDPFWEPARGLHFLFGLLTHEAGTPGADAPDAEAYDHATWRYQTIWAHDRAGERQALERLVDFFHERLKDHPDMHVYHYGAYEPTALKQLMGVYATREDAMDALLRREVFCDLHSVVRQGLRAGVPGYSLKEVEALPAFRRQANLKNGTRAVLAYEEWMTTRAAARLEEIEAYNEEDCRATLALRDWLVEHRPEGAPWAEPPEARPADGDRQKADAQREVLRQALLVGATPQTPRWLAAERLEYHRREARPPWRGPLSGARGDPGRAAAAAHGRIRRADPDDGPSRAARASRRARPELPLHPGAAGHRQDVDGRANRRRSDPPRPARRRRGHEPQGDSQPARRDRQGRPRGRCAGPRSQEMQRRQRRDGIR